MLGELSETPDEVPSRHSGSDGHCGRSCAHREANLVTNSSHTHPLHSDSRTTRIRSPWRAIDSTSPCSCELRSKVLVHRVFQQFNDIPQSLSTCVFIDAVNVLVGLRSRALQSARRSLETRTWIEIDRAEDIFIYDRVKTTCVILRP